MKKIVLMTLGIGALFAGLFIIKKTRKPANTKAYTIGILQTASHPALDAARNGFIQELQEKLGDTVEFIVQNGQGSVTTIHALAQQFHANNQLNGFFTIATPTTQALAALEKTRPIIIAAVTDPKALGLMSPATNITGVTDMINVQAEIDMLVTLIPHAKTIGLLYTSGETNSIALVKQMRKELETRGLQAIDFTINGEADIPAVVELACRKADALLAPTDNTVASAIALVASLALKHKKPLIVSDNTLVSAGALAARGVDYKASGKQAANIAYKVLVEGKKPYQLAIEQANSKEIYINATTVNSLGLTIPASLKEHVILVS